MKDKKVVFALMAAVLLVLPIAMIASAAGPGDPDTTIIVTNATLECGSTATSQILITIVNQEADPREVRGVEVHLTFDPNLVRVVDADGDPGNGVQLTIESGLFDGDLRIGQNLADNEVGIIDFAVAHSNGTPVFNAAEKAIATITWECAGECPPEEVETEVMVAGNTLMSDPDGYFVVADSAVSGIITIPTCVSGCIQGYVFPQSRYDFGGGRVVAGDHQAYTDASGYFKLEGVEAGIYDVIAEMMYGYLESKAPGVEVVAGTEMCTDIDATKLLGGELVPEGVIDISDTAYIVSRLYGADVTADVTGDGVVNILDLSMAAANSGRTGPTPWLPPTDPMPWMKDPYTAVKVTDASFGCGETGTSRILVSIANDPTRPRPMHGVEVRLSFDPTKLQVVDVVAEDDLFPGGLFSLDEQVIVREVDNEAGTILFVMTWLDGDSIQDATDAAIATITWTTAHGVDCTTTTEPLCSNVNVVDALMSDADGYAIGVDERVPGIICSIIESGCIRGSVHLQGRYDHSGARIIATDDVGTPVAETLTDAAGNFEWPNLTPATYDVWAEMYGYLDSLASDVVIVAGECTGVGATKLLGGDVAPQPEPDNVIDIGDVTYIASRFRGPDMSADVNADGMVNIQDLTVASANFGLAYPTPWAE